MRLATCVVVGLLVLAVCSVVMADKEKAWVAPVPGITASLDCSNAIPISCGNVVQGNNTGFPSNVSSYSCVGWNESGPEVVYKLVLPGPLGARVTAALSGMTVDLDVYILGSCDETNCIAYGDYSATTGDCLHPGTYYIVVDGYAGAAGAYTLTVTCADCALPCCPLPYTCFTCDFNQSPCGFVTLACGGGAPAWAWGPPTGIPTTSCNLVPVTNVLATVLNGNYPANGGETAMIGPFDLTTCCSCMELCHFHDFEASYDGGNVKVSTDAGVTWTLVTPSRGYDGSTNSSPKCIPNQMAFTGHTHNTAFMQDCFDLSQFVGHQVWIGFFYGSDSSVQYPGWYIKWVKFGSSLPSATEGRSWGSIKSLYR